MSEVVAADVQQRSLAAAPATAAARVDGAARQAIGSCCRIPTCSIGAQRHRRAAPSGRSRRQKRPAISTVMHHAVAAGRGGALVTAATAATVSGSPRARWRAPTFSGDHAAVRQQQHLQRSRPRGGTGAHRVQAHAARSRRSTNSPAASPALGDLEAARDVARRLLQRHLVLAAEAALARPRYSTSESERPDRRRSRTTASSRVCRPCGARSRCTAPTGRTSGFSSSCALRITERPVTAWRKVGITSPSRRLWNSSK